ncbi:hypothetical protein NADFUDRAFT_52750 [Nadsonia fulvescens var. elongata DSM 6958]|uniref:VHS domain-containing protein n=1 Tax=Nadsonia fulvescens var. elongata DSM 6958 TaxID=857566 RepID=A0A1E3PGT0_9ASCO|nr:hypothetical protein NADFUDRAFT_52750 [Nadsonia fulvescens var. elongata DSM 6958]
MGFLSEKPYTAVSSSIEAMTRHDSEQEDIVEIIELLDIIRLQPTGPTEAARALRKKLKYGSNQQQMRALIILETLVANGGKKLRPLYQDENLLERLRILATAQVSSPIVKKKVQSLFLGWHNEYKGVNGYEQLAALYKQLPLKRKPARNYADDEVDERDRYRQGGSNYSSGNLSGKRGSDISRDTGNARQYYSSSSRVSSNGNYGNTGNSTGSVSRSRSGSGTSRAYLPVTVAPISRLDSKEKAKIKSVLAEAQAASTDLSNALKMTNREEELSTENEEATEHFEKCKLLRRAVLKYIHSSESEDLIGALIHVNEELINSLQTYEEFSRPMDDDSDSEYDYDDEPEEGKSDSSIQQGMAKIQLDSGNITDSESENEFIPSQGPSPPKRRNPPPIPSKPKTLSHVETQDDDNPFGDSHVI